MRAVPGPGKTRDDAQVNPVLGGKQANPLGGRGRTETKKWADVLPGDGESDPGNDWSREKVKIAKFRTAKLTEIDIPCVSEEELDHAIGEVGRLIGEDEATAYGHDMLKLKLELVRAVYSVGCKTKDWALGQEGRKSKGGKQGQHPRLRYD